MSDLDSRPDNATIHRDMAKRVCELTIEIDYDIHEGVIHVFPVPEPDSISQAPKMDIEPRQLSLPELVDLPAKKFHVQKTKQLTY